MPGPRCVKFLAQQMFPGNSLIVDTITEQDSKRRFSEVIPMVSAFNYVVDNELQLMIENYYDEFANDKSFIHCYGLYIPTVIDDLTDESISIVVDLFKSITTTMTKEQYIEYVLENIASSFWSKRIACEFIRFELTGLKIMREHLTMVQEELGVSFGPLI